MYEPSHGVGQSIEFRLPNVGAGPDRYEAADLDSGSGVALVLLLRNHYCPLSRRKVRQLSARIDEFEAEHVPVVAVLPDSIDQATVWRRRYDPPFPLLADPADEPDPTGRVDERGVSPNRFDAFADVQDWIPRTPGLVVVETFGDDPTVGQIYSGPTPQDCPSVDEMLDIARNARLEDDAIQQTPAV